MNPAQQRDYTEALAAFPAKHRAWLEDGDIELFAYYGWGVMLNDAQLTHIHDVISWPPGAVHVWRWANRTGKLAPIDEPVLTPSGWRPIGDLAAGDPIIAGDGSATTVTGVFPQGRKAIYRLTFDDGAWTRAGAEHLWTVQTPEARFRKPGSRTNGQGWSGERLAASYGQWSVLSTADMIDRWGMTPRPRQRCAVPVAVDISGYPATLVPLDPYVLGLLLGDGGLSGSSVSFTSADRELVEAIRSSVPGVTVRSRTARGMDWAVTRGGVVPALRSLGLMGHKSATKFIPPLYLHNARAVRLALLQGLMDTDGTVGISGAADYSTISPQLAEDIVALVRSLGGKASSVKRQTYYTYLGERKAGQPSYRITIRQSDLPLFRLERKAARLVLPPYRHRRERVLCRIEPDGEAESVCIAVAHPSQTYITRDFIVTHNTTGLDILYAWAAWFKWRFESAAFDDWFRYRYKVLHASPLSELAGKAHELFGALIDGSADQQRSPITHLPRPALLASFYTATKTVDVNDVDRPVVNVANGSQIDFRSTQGGSARLESDQWWLVGWDEFPRQQPPDQIPVLFDQTFLPRTSDYMAPLILAGTATIDSEYIYAELEDIAIESTNAGNRDWNFTQAARTANFASTRESQDRQRRMSIDKDVAARSLDGVGGGVGGTMFPAFLLDNAFRAGMPERIVPPAVDDEVGWTRRTAFKRAFVTSFDHALAHDDNVYLDLDGPWPPHLATPADPFIGASLTLVKGSRTLTPDEQKAYLSRDVRAYRSKVAVIDSTGPGGLSVYRAALQDGLPVVDCNLQARAAKWVTNKEWALQALQRMLAYGLPFEPPTTGFIDEWPEAPEGLEFGLFRFPNTGPWLKMHRQLSVYKRDDEKLRQDAAMTLVQLAWYLWKFLAHARAGKGPTPFNPMSRRVSGRRFAARR